MFQVKDEYANEVTQLARPLPVEYLLVDMPAAFPVEPKFTFHGGHDTKPFPIEHRAEIGEIAVSCLFCIFIESHDQLEEIMPLSGKQCRHFVQHLALEYDVVHKLILITCFLFRILML